MIDPEALWLERCVEIETPLDRIDVKARLLAAETRCADDVAIHIPDYLLLYDEAVQCLMQLHGMVEGVQAVNKSRSVSTCMLSLAKACACLIGIRRLVIAGLEEIARPIARSLSETFDIALLCLLDDSFASSYLSDQTYDPNKFWQEHLGRGKLAKRIKALLKNAGVSSEQIDQYLKSASESNSLHSTSVHSSMSSIFRSAAIPSLVKADEFSMDYVGHASALSPYLLYDVADRAYTFAELIGVILTERLAVPSLDVVQQDRDRAAAFFISLFVLQDCLQHLSAELHDRYGWGST